MIVTRQRLFPKESKDYIEARKDCYSLHGGRLNGCSLFINLNKKKIMAQVNAKRLNDAVEILDDYCEVFDNKEYDLLSEQEKTLLYNATVLLEKVVIRMQNHGDYSLKQKRL